MLQNEADSLGLSELIKHVLSLQTLLVIVIKQLLSRLGCSFFLGKVLKEIIDLGIEGAVHLGDLQFVLK